jgi:hypothetical protein
MGAIKKVLMEWGGGLGDCLVPKIAPYLDSTLGLRAVLTSSHA